MAVKRTKEDAGKINLRPGSQTAGRALQLLKLLVEHDLPIGLADITALSGLDKSAAYRLLRELEAQGFIGRDATTKRYTLGGELMALSSRVLSKVDLRTYARPVMERLVAMTSETVILNIRSGYKKLSIDGIESPYSVRRALALGESVSLLSTPSGRAMLAFLPHREIDSLVATANQKEFEVAELNRQIQFVRHHRYLVSSGQRRLGASVLAVPVFSAAGVVGAIAVSGPRERWTMRLIKKHCPAIVDSCATISQSLGYRDAFG